MAKKSNNVDKMNVGLEHWEEITIWVEISCWWSALSECFSARSPTVQINQIIQACNKVTKTSINTSMIHNKNGHVSSVESLMSV